VPLSNTGLLCIDGDPATLRAFADLVGEYPFEEP
jgi:hypothetical protein